MPVSHNRQQDTENLREEHIGARKERGEHKNTEEFRAPQGWAALCAMTFLVVVTAAVTTGSNALTQQQMRQDPIALLMKKQMNRCRGTPVSSCAKIATLPRTDVRSSSLLFTCGTSKACCYVSRGWASFGMARCGADRSQTGCFMLKPGVVFYRSSVFDSPQV